MPIYEYQCQKCGDFEVTQKITDKPLARCPTCKGKVKKLISNTSFQLKGTGWYVTDYQRKEKPEPDGKASKGEPKTDAKPASDGGGTASPGETKSSKTASESTPASSASK
ncbi:MAG: FmdB family zinc ribbon protein [Candidatus Binatia bacterium]